MKINLTSSWVSQQKQTPATACEDHVLWMPATFALAPSGVLLSSLSRSLLNLRRNLESNLHTQWIIQFYQSLEHVQEVMQQYMIWASLHLKPRFTTVRASGSHSIECANRNEKTPFTAWTLKFKTAHILWLNNNALLGSQFTSLVMP
jgi:hypothetical protein